MFINKILVIQVIATNNIRQILLQYNVFIRLKCTEGKKFTEILSPQQHRCYMRQFAYILIEQ